MEKPSKVSWPPNSSLRRSWSRSFHETIRALHRSASFCKRCFGPLGAILTDLRFSEQDVVICLSEEIEDKPLETLIELSLRARFPNACTAWERRRKEVMQSFQGTITERQAEMHVRLEQNFEDLRIKLQEAVVAEVAETAYACLTLSLVVYNCHCHSGIV